MMLSIRDIFQIGIGVVCLVVAIVPMLPYVVRWVRRCYYRHPVVVSERFLRFDKTIIRPSCVNQMINDASGQPHCHPWRKMDTEVEKWLSEERISHWFDFTRVGAYAAGRLCFRNESDRAYFVMRFYHLAVLEHD